MPTKRKKSKPNPLDLFKDSLKADGTIDGRSTYGKAVKSVKTAFSEDLQGASKEILQDHIAVSLVLQRTIEAHLVSNPALLTSQAKGEYFINLLLKLENETRKNVNDLNRLEQKAKGSKGNGQSIDDIILS